MWCRLFIIPGTFGAYCAGNSSKKKRVLLCLTFLWNSDSLFFAYVPCTKGKNIAHWLLPHEISAFLFFVCVGKPTFNCIEFGFSRFVSSRYVVCECRPGFAGRFCEREEKPGERRARQVLAFKFKLCNVVHYIYFCVNVRDVSSSIIAGAEGGPPGKGGGGGREGEEQVSK